MAKNALTESFDGLPGWAWPLVALCFFIPVATLGGAIPIVLGLGGGMGVANLAKNSGRSTGARVALSIALTLLVWIGLGVTVWLTHRSR